MNRKTEPLKVEPKLIDKALAPLIKELQGLSWLDSAYGKCEALPTDESFRKFKPAVYAGRPNGSGVKWEYLELLPDGKLGNYSFFDVPDRVGLSMERGDLPVLDFQAGLVVWFDFRKVYKSDHVYKTTENVKNEILEVMKYSRVKLVVESTEDRVPKIYAGYEYRDMNSLFSQRPYGCFRINLRIIYNEGLNC